MDIAIFDNKYSFYESLADSRRLEFQQDSLAGKASVRRSATVRPLVPPPTTTKSYLSRSCETCRFRLALDILAALARAASDTKAAPRKPMLTEQLVLQME